MTTKLKLNSKNSSSRLDIARMNRKELAKRATGKHSKIKSRTRKIAKIFMIFIVIILIGMLGGSVAAFSWLQSLNDGLPTPESVFVDPPVPSVIYDRNGKELFRAIGDFNSELVDIESVPEHVKWAFLASEDADFYTHSGFDTSGILNCGFQIVRSSGDRFCGGSTVTQQLIKMTALRDEQNRVVRKIKELFMATKVEQNSEKDEILQMYLSVAPFGSNTVGLESASKYYFRKEPKDLTLAQAAILAGIVQSPSYLSPTRPYDGDTETAQARIKARQEGHVLFQLERKLSDINKQIEINARNKAASNGEEFDIEKVAFITQEQIDEAKEEELKYASPVASDKLAGHFVDFVLNDLQTKNIKNGEEPFTLSELQNNGYRITTTLDYEIQQTAERYSAAGGNDYKYWNVHNAALMTMVPSTGEILSMAGSKGFVGESEACDGNGQNCKYNPEVNVLTTLQSPGSTNKSLAFYKAFEQGKIYPGSHLPDIPITIGSYVPKNWDGRFTGVNHTARDMLRQSRNIPALLVVEMIGVETYLNTSRDFGYTTYTDDSQIGHSVVLGGTSVYPVEHAAAYGVFANQGNYVAPQSVLKIEDRNGNVIYEYKAQPKQVGSPQASYLLNQTLMNLETGTGGNIAWDNREIAGKTGTSEENKDSWLVVYSPDFVTLGWAGNNNNDPLDPAYGYPGFVVAPWLKGYMAEIGNKPYFAAKTGFARPGFVSRGGGGCNDNGECTGVRSDWMIDGLSMSPDFKNERGWVCKDQQTKKALPIHISSGLAIEKSFQKFFMKPAVWQNFMDEYLKQRGFPNGMPTENCTIDPTGGQPGPFVTLQSPAEGQTYTGTMQVKGGIYTTTGSITQFSITFNGGVIGNQDTVSNASDFTINVDLSSLDNGVYPLVIAATDSEGVANSKSYSIIVGGATSSNFTFTIPPAGVVGAPSLLRAQYASSLRNWSIFASRNGGGYSQIAGCTAANTANFTCNWTPTEAGSYTFYVTAETAAGARLTSVASPAITVP